MLLAYMPRRNTSKKKICLIVEADARQPRLAFCSYAPPGSEFRQPLHRALRLGCQ
jgi:hypothetical protein